MTSPMSLVTPAELMREGAMLSAFIDGFHEYCIRGEWHIVAILSPDGVHLSTAEFITYTEEGSTFVAPLVHFDIDGNYPSSECVACVSALEEHLDHPTQNDRLTEQARRFEEPDQSMRMLLAQFKLKSTVLGAEALSAVISNCPVAPE